MRFSAKKIEFRKFARISYPQKVYVQRVNLKTIYMRIGEATQLAIPENLVLVCQIFLLLAEKNRQLRDQKAH